MKRIIALSVWAYLTLPLQAQKVLSIDDCRSLALENNKELLMAQEQINATRHKRKAAFTSYLPALSATGSYMHNSKEIAILSDSQKASLSHMGTAVIGALGKDPALAQALQGVLMKYPDLAPLIGSLSKNVLPSIANNLDAFGQQLAEGSRTDTRNVYVGAVTLTQPLYMGGKIRAYNKITKYAEQLAQQKQRSDKAEVILSVDQAYWQVISLVNKHKLSVEYLNLLRQLEADVQLLVDEGVATKADLLSVKVKVNEAEITMSKVEDGLSLSKMLLCQLCGLSLNTELSLADEALSDIPISSYNGTMEVQQAFENRSELKSLELLTKISNQKVKLELSSHLPHVALVGNYLVSNPSSYNGFENKFGAMWNVGVMVTVPLWNWGEGYHKIRAARSEARMSQLQLDNAKEKIELQVNQSTARVKEAQKRLTMAVQNLAHADENLRYATLGHKEGISTTANVLEAQTAWLSAQSSKIDAQIDVRLSDVYLRKALGHL